MEAQTNREKLCFTSKLFYPPDLLGFTASHQDSESEAQSYPGNTQDTTNSGLSLLTGVVFQLQVEV